MANSTTILEKPIHVGDTVSIVYGFMDKEKEKTQVYAGIVIQIRGMGSGKTFTVRKMTKSKIGVERIFPVSSPFIKKIEVTRKTHNTRANVGYIRTRSERDIREQLYTK